MHGSPHQLILRNLCTGTAVGPTAAVPVLFIVFGNEMAGSTAAADLASHSRPLDPRVGLYTYVYTAYSLLDLVQLIHLYY